MSHDQAITRDYRLLPVFHRHDTRSFLCVFSREYSRTDRSSITTPTSLFCLPRRAEIRDHKDVGPAFTSPSRPRLILGDLHVDITSSGVYRIHSISSPLALTYYCGNLRTQKPHDINHRPDPKE